MLSAAVSSQLCVHEKCAQAAHHCVILSSICQGGAVSLSHPLIRNIITFAMDL